MKRRVYIGSFTNNLTIWEYDIQSRQFEFKKLIQSLSPSWLHISTTKTILFTTNEVDNYNGKPTGAVSSYSIEGDGDLTLLSQVESAGKHPTHLEFYVLPNQLLSSSDNDDVASLQDQAHHYSHTLFVSNYSSGSYSVHKVEESGKISEPIQSIVHSPTISQPITHVHQTFITSSSSGNTVLTVVDLGISQILQYQVDSVSGLLMDPYTVVNKIEFPFHSGSRHIVIHPTEPIAFVICELANGFVPLKYDHSTGLLGLFHPQIEILSTLRPEETLEDMTGGEIRLSTNGKFIYASNRDNSQPNRNRSSIAVFEILDPLNGSVGLRQIVYSGGNHPRHFTLIEDDSQLLIANKDSGNLVSYRVNPTTGLIDEKSMVTTESSILIEPTFLLVV